MNKVATLSERDRKDLFHEVSARKGFSEAIAEKDFWVCWVLMKLFAHSEISRKILFKGGTSLSKVFHLIERFSEDSVPRRLKLRRQRQPCCIQDDGRPIAITI